MTYYSIEWVRDIKAVIEKEEFWSQNLGWLWDSVGKYDYTKRNNKIAKEKMIVRSC